MFRLRFIAFYLKIPTFLVYGNLAKQSPVHLDCVKRRTLEGSNCICLEVFSCVLRHWRDLVSGLPDTLLVVVCIQLKLSQTNQNTSSRKCHTGDGDNGVSTFASRQNGFRNRLILLRTCAKASRYFLPFGKIFLKKPCGTEPSFCKPRWYLKFHCPLTCFLQRWQP